MSTGVPTKSKILWGGKKKPESLLLAFGLYVQTKLIAGKKTGKPVSVTRHSLGICVIRKCVHSGSPFVRGLPAAKTWLAVLWA